jgi:hypothetical protein
MMGPMRGAWLPMVCLACGNGEVPHSDAAPAPDSRSSRPDAPLAQPDAPLAQPDAMPATPDGGADAMTGGPDAGAGDFAIALLRTSGTIDLSGASSVAINVGVLRTAPFNGSISVTVGGVGNGVTVTPSPLVLSSTDSGGVIGLTATQAADQGPFALTLTGTASVGSHATPYALLVRDASGKPDTSFNRPGGTGSLSIPGIYNFVTGIGFTSGGQMIVSTDMSIVRLKLDGTGIDPTFGGSTGVTPGIGSIVAMRVQPDDRVVALTGAGIVVRYDTTGALDSSFGTAGQASVSGIFQAGAAVTAYDMTILDSSNDIVTLYQIDNLTYYLAALLPDGTRDFGLNGSGRQNVQPQSSATTLHLGSIVNLPGAGLLVATTTHDLSGSEDVYMVTHHGTDLSLDVNFAAGFPGAPTATLVLGAGFDLTNPHLATNAAGGIAASAAFTDSGGTHYTLFGTLSTAGVWGLQSGAPLTSTPYSSGLVAADGTSSTEPLVGGTDGVSTYLARFVTPGDFDTTFGMSGVATEPYANLGALVIDPSNEIVIGGASSSGIYVARFWK